MEPAISEAQENSNASCGMRPNYSCGSLAAAEQLEALMRHSAPSGGACCGMLLGSEQQGAMNRAMKQQGFVNGGAAPIQSFLGNHSPSAIQAGVDPSACGTAFGMPGGEGFSPSPLTPARLPGAHARARWFLSRSGKKGSATCFFFSKRDAATFFDRHSCIHKIQRGS